jgi:hypothetical protein
MYESSDISGLAALTVCESLLLALNDGEVMPETAIIGVLVNAAGALERVRNGDANAEASALAAQLIRKIISGGNSVRRP